MFALFDYFFNIFAISLCNSECDFNLRKLHGVNYIYLFTEIDDFDLLLIALINMEALLVQRRRNRINCERRRRRRVWVRAINTRRRQQGAFYNLFQEIKTDRQMFHKYTRMTLPTFQHLIDIVNPSLIKRSPRALEPEQRVALTLR